MDAPVLPASFDPDASRVATASNGGVARREAIEHAARFERRVHRVREGVWCVVGNGLSNQTFVEGPSGLIAIDTYVQRVVPEHVRGRVWGSRFMLTQGAYAVSVLTAGALLTVVGPQTLFVVAGLVVAVPALVAVFVPALRDA